ncbi:hypothetical protein LAZ67_18002702 [Cordylochernes scorpioides]|uniref:C2 domain-containing protein n=1 Tax=Cordylochernes scorpioides TaxID=51811 RepID=A0ABY6LGQ2_9ARAC|nr:hypothetical protein LAZ67_18002702 [Cordylochernes scorpioides]
MKPAEGTELTAHLKLVGAPQYTVEAVPPAPRKHREDSTYSSMSTSSRGDGSVSAHEVHDSHGVYQSEVPLDTPPASNEPDINYGQITFSATYREPESSPGELVLVIKDFGPRTISSQYSLNLPTNQGPLRYEVDTGNRAKEAQDLPPRLYGGACDPYIAVSVGKDRGRKRWSRGASTLYEFRTTTKRRTQHPLFKETFLMELGRQDLKDCRLRVSAFDDERLANDTELGQLSSPLRDLDIGPEPSIFTLDFGEPKQERGELLFGMSYLPTAERLTFSIVKANNLKPVTETVEAFAPCVRILLLLHGKLVKKKKTSSKLGTTCPVYNETLTFDIPPSQLDNVTLVLVASHREPAAPASPDSPTSPPNGKKARHVGKVVVGAHSRGIASHHWNVMRQTPRKLVTQWHTLR